MPVRVRTGLPGALAVAEHLGSTGAERLIDAFDRLAALPDVRAITALLG
ncbi:MAG TPA: hypothetical protein VJX10_08670 [Pseudonocardiaceae bacterium]|nr:hypothetical protein [Pseudonocardiaceae bacterium]